MRGLKDKVVIVTGSASGIGRALALRFGAEGALVALFDINEAGAAEATSTITAAGGKALTYRVDITDRDSIETAVAALETATGRIDVLVNNAGWDIPIPFVDTDRAFWDKVIAINLYGPLNMHHVVLPRMMDKKAGRIVSTILTAEAGASSGMSVEGGQQFDEPPGAGGKERWTVPLAGRALGRFAARRIGRDHVGEGRDFQLVRHGERDGGDLIARALADDDGAENAALAVGHDLGEPVDVLFRLRPVIVLERPFDRADAVAALLPRARFRKADRGDLGLGINGAGAECVPAPRRRLEAEIADDRARVIAGDMSIGAARDIADREDALVRRPEALIDEDASLVGADAGLGEAKRNRPPNAARCAGDECGVAFQQSALAHRCPCRKWILCLDLLHQVRNSYFRTLHWIPPNLDL